MEKQNPNRGIVVPLILCCAVINIAQGFPSQMDDFRNIDYSSPGLYQFNNWLASQIRPKEIIAPIDVPIIPYRLPLQTKRNSEVTNAIVGSDEPQKMYRDGRK